MNDTLFREMERNARKNKIPIGGQFELTPRCTLDCKMCYVHLSHEQMKLNTELSTDEWIRIIDEAYRQGLLFSLLTGGECMLHPGFSAIYRHLHEIGVFVTINTNGFILSDENFELLKTLPPYAVNISLYGASEEVYERVTGVRAFDRVLNNIRRLRDAGINVSVSVTPSTYLFDDVVNILTLCKDERLKYNLTFSLVDAREDTGRSIMNYGLSAEEEISLREVVRKTTGKQLYSNSDSFLPPERCSANVECKGIECNAGRGSYAVTWDGVLHPCFRVMDVGVSLKKKSFADAWRTISDATDSIVIPSECESCSAKRSCNSCYIMRADPQDPRHCNRDMCKRTLLKIQNGLEKYPK